MITFNPSVHNSFMAWPHAGVKWFRSIYLHMRVCHVVYQEMGPSPFSKTFHSTNIADYWDNSLFWHSHVYNKSFASPYNSRLLKKNQFAESGTICRRYFLIRKVFYFHANSTEIVLCPITIIQHNAALLDVDRWQAITWTNNGFVD